MAGKLPSVLMRAGEDRRVRAGHPWAFSNEILMDPETRALPAGSLVILRAPGGEALGLATFNPHSLIAARVLTSNPEATADALFFGRRFARAVAGVAFVASSAREYSEAERERRRAGALPGDRPRKANPGVALGLHPDRETDPALLDRLRTMQRRLGPDVRARQSALIRKDGYADLERITCPSLVVACRQDRLRTLAETERMARHLPNARFEVIEDCGHMAPLEKPHELAALVEGWIAASGL